MMEAIFSLLTCIVNWADCPFALASVLRGLCKETLANLKVPVFRLPSVYLPWRGSINHDCESYHWSTTDYYFKCDYYRDKITILIDRQSGCSCNSYCTPDQWDFKKVSKKDLLPHEEEVLEAYYVAKEVVRNARLKLTVNLGYEEDFPLGGKIHLFLVPKKGAVFPLEMASKYSIDGVEYFRTGKANPDECVELTVEHVRSIMGAPPSSDDDFCDLSSDKDDEPPSRYPTPGPVADWLREMNGVEV